MRVIALVMMLPFAVSAQSALPADVRTACDGAFAIVSKSQGIKTRRANGSFNDETFRAPIPGCRIEIDGSFKKAGKGGVAADNLHTQWMSSGWQEIGEFSADGPDGTSYAFKKGAAACFVRGQWDGGDDSDPDAPVDDGYKIVVICGKAANFVRSQ